MKMKWYWVVLLAIVALVIGHIIGKSIASANETLFKGKISSDLKSVLGQMNTSDGTRISPATRSGLLNRRDSLLKLANPTPNSGSIILFDGNGYWNGWTYVNAPAGILSAGGKCKAAGNFWIFDPTIPGYICSTIQNPY